MIDLLQPPELHRITERDGGPDLDDLVNVIRYLRENGVQVVTGTMARRIGHESYNRLHLSWYPGDAWMRQFRLNEAIPAEVDEASSAVFVGPDGTVYDENREAL